MAKRVISHTPQYWRDRAEETRRVADLITDPDAKQKMLGVAESYEKLALGAEKLLASKADA
jgi:hypothetical protein